MKLNQLATFATHIMYLHHYLFVLACLLVLVFIYAERMGLILIVQIRKITF